jgi:hypothetical protein
MPAVVKGKRNPSKRLDKKETSIKDCQRFILDPRAGCMVLVTFWPDDVLCRCLLPTWLVARPYRFIRVIRRLVGPCVTSTDLIVLAGDVSIHDPIAVKRDNLLSRHYMMQRVQVASYDAGGMLDVSYTRDDQPPSPVAIHDVCVLDHRLLRCTSYLQRPPTNLRHVDPQIMALR